MDSYVMRSNNLCSFIVRDGAGVGSSRKDAGSHQFEKKQFDFCDIEMEKGIQS